MRFTSVAILLFTCASATPEDIQLTVMAGAGGTVRNGSTAPVQVIVTNNGEAVSAAVVVQWLDSMQTRPVVSDFRTVELPQNSTKRLTIYSEPSQWTNGVQVTLREFDGGGDPRRGDVLAEYSEKIAVLDAERPVVGVIGPALGGLPRPLNKNGEEWSTRLYFPEEFLPDDALGWEMCDVVFYAPSPGATPPSTQLRALRDYVFLGGDLVVIASEPSEVFTSPGFSNFLPFVPSGQEQGFISALGVDSLYSVGSIYKGTILLDQAGTPLAVRRGYGLGSVTAIAFDLRGQAGAQSNELEQLWQRVAPEIYAIPEENEQIVFASDPFDAFTERLLSTVTRTPDVRIQLVVVVFLIGLYAFAVGPGDFLLARRYKRPMLTWITFPSMVLIFTSLAFLGARVWVGGQAELHANQIKTFFPEGVLLNEAIGYFAATTAFYDLQAETSLRALALSMDSPDSTLVDGDGGRRIQRIPTWTARGFTTTRISDAETPVSYRVEFPGHKLVLHVSNDSHQNLRPTALVRRGLRYPILESEAGVIEPGAECTIEIPSNRAMDKRATPHEPGFINVFSELSTHAPRYRSWDHRPLVNENALVLTLVVVEPESATLRVDGEESAALSTRETWHIVNREGNDQ